MSTYRLPFPIRVFMARTSLCLSACPNSFTFRLTLFTPLHPDVSSLTVVVVVSVVVLVVVVVVVVVAGTIALVVVVVVVVAAGITLGVVAGTVVEQQFL